MTRTWEIVSLNYDRNSWNDLYVAIASSLSSG